MCTQCVINIVSDVVEDILAEGIPITTPMLYDIIAEEADDIIAEEADDEFTVTDVAIKWANIGAPFEIEALVTELASGWKPEAK